MSHFRLRRISPENAWCLYDWGNSAFVTTIVATVLPIYFAETVCGGGPVHWSLLGGQMTNSATSLWGYAMALAALLVALLAPVFGAAADAGGRRKQFLGVMTVVGAGAAAAMALAGEGDIWLVLTLLVVGEMGFAGASVFYNSLLVSTVPPSRRDVISARGYAMGYMGGGILLAINLLMIRKPGLFGLADGEAAVRMTFVSVAVWWALFSIPLFRRVPEGRSGGETTFRGSFRQGMSTLSSTFRHIRGTRNAFRFLLAFLLYNDGIQTVIIMATIFGKTELGLDSGTLIGALLLTQAVGVPGSILFGKAAGRFGAKRMLSIGIAVYLLVVVYAFRMSSAADFWALAGVVGLIMGGMQAVSRSLFSRLIPEDMNAEYYGFFSISQRFASIFGPLLFALVNDITGSSRVSILSLAVLFVSGWAILRSVRDPGGDTC